MNKKDKLLSLNKVQCIVMVFILVIGCLVTSFTYAVESSMQVNLAAVNGDPGTTVTVPLTLKNVPSSGIYTCSFWVTYDPQTFTSVSIASGNLITNTNDFHSNVNSEMGFVAMTFEAPADGSRMIKSDGTIAQIQLKIKSTASDGIYNLNYNLSRCAVYASGTDEITGVIYNGGSVIVGDATPTIAPTAIATESSIPTVTPSAIATVKPISVVTTTATPTPAITTLAEVTMIPSTQLTPTPSPEVTITPIITGELAIPKDINTHWAKLYITKLIKLEVIQGYPDGTIKPDNNINRAEAVTALMKSKGYSPSENAEFSFADSNAIPTWVKGFLKTALDLKVVGGYEDNTFRASRNVTRQEVVVMLMKTFGFEASEGQDLVIADEGKIASWSKKYINTACKLGIVKGYSDNTFKPDKNVTRAELFTMISKCLEYMENQ